MYSLVEQIRKVGKDREMHLGHEMLQKDQNKRAQMDIADTRKDIEDIQSRNAQLLHDIQREDTQKQTEQKNLQGLNSQVAELKVNLNGLKDQLFYQE